MFEPPKILGDVFESMVGAIFIDGGIEKVIQVLEPLLAPFTLFIAKFNKRLYREPKDEFQQASALVKITPKWNSYEVEVADTVDGFMHALSTREDPKELYRVGGS
jgi:dsRNA-specific ribonuclease